MKVSWKKASLGRERRLTAGGAHHDHPRLVPGTSHLIHRMRGDHGEGLVLTDLRGRLVQPLILAPGEFGPLVPDREGRKGFFAYRAAPDQSWILHSLTLPGGDPPEESVLLECPGAQARDPLPHPEGDRFLFSSDEASPGSFHIWEAYPERKEKRPLTAHPDRSDDQPTLSPSGRFLVFRGQVGGETDLYLLDLTTQETRRLTAAPGLSGEPTFVDEYRLVFSRTLPSGDKGLLLLDILRGKERWISDALRRLGQPQARVTPRGRVELYYSVPRLEGGKEVGAEICAARLEGLRIGTD